ncbi:HB2L protein, partial [Grallaria varia]|nr:HB2L protein [Grallaria varia]
GASRALPPAHPGVRQYMGKGDCTFINGTDRVRLVGKFIYNREQFVHFDSDLGRFVGDTLYGEKVARRLNSDRATLEDSRALVDRCRHNCEVFTPFLVNRRVSTSPSQSLP